MIKTRLPDTPIACSRCLEQITPPFVLYNLPNIVLNLCVPCADYIARGIYHNVGSIRDIEEGVLAKAGKRQPMNPYQPKFKTYQPERKR